MLESTTTVPQKAKQVAKLLRSERPDYFYLKELFRQLRKILDVKVQNKSKKLPYVPSDEEIKKYYEAVWDTQNIKHMIIIKTMLYTGVRVGELVKIKIDDVELNKCQIRINDGKGKKDRIVPFPTDFREVLALYIKSIKNKKKVEYLFESNWNKPYSERGIRKILMTYTQQANMNHTITPHKLRHFLFTWMKKQGIDDALIQPYSGHESRQSLEIYSKLSITDAQKTYNKVINDFPI
ncbi:tyrosine-type recombinase/integrase [Rickettsia endosymbiont of Oedothorax gibbosus]|uniref:tyrosine-type recombinase/integrase n=1 Tax=Rickettsia endosymbiont of Oedothorax gibbosus TaxID=931099 RepID=UPI0020252D21|nr:tyrosine-type recombinase/integrase [Rickettsia endosymbiont of Oedothorax gibbosus]